MRARSGKRTFIGVAFAVCVCATPLSAKAGDFFSNLFGTLGMRPPAPRPQTVLPFTNEDSPGEVPRRRVASARGQAWCVRGCDGRYFPVAGPDDQSRAESCHSFCPASETRLVYGSDVDNAVSENGKPYSELPNAFRYRSEIVAGCTCNGKDAAGLAKVAIENDPTLRKGDIVAGENGMVAVASPATAKHAAANFTPLPPALQARFRHLSVVARE
jgi:hypothetical protein